MARVRPPITTKAQYKAWKKFQKAMKKKTKDPKRTKKPRLNRVTGGFLGLENKFKDTYWSSQAVGDYNDPALASMTPTGSSSIVEISAGTGPSNRDGREVTVNSILIRGTLKDIPDDPVTHVCDDRSVRLLLVQDTQANGALPALGDILDNANAVATTNGELGINNFNNLENSSRFKILHDEILELTQGPAIYNYGTSVVSNAVRKHHFQIYKPVNFKVSYDGTAGTLGTIVKNNIILVVYASESTRAYLYLDAQARVRFMG